jgi:hypothetical protein
VGSLDQENLGEGEKIMSSDGTPDKGSLTPQEWNRVTQSLISLSAVVTNTASAVHETSDNSNARTGKGNDKK